MRVAVTVAHRPNNPKETGGLAGTWERVSEVAVGREDVDLTVFFIGNPGTVRRVASNVRHEQVPPAFASEWVPFLRAIPTRTDLAPLNPMLYRRLRGFDVIHTTDVFNAFAESAYLQAARRGVPMTTSIQTDVIGWARIYLPRVLREFLPEAGVRWLLNGGRYLERRERGMIEKLARHLRRCRTALVSHERDRERVAQLAPETPVAHFRRGLDLELFHPRRGDPAELRRRYSIPQDRTLLLFAGRIDPAKGALTAACTVRRLLDAGRGVHLLVAGEGVQKGDIADLLGERASFAGNLPHGELAPVYAGSDLLLFPSRAEVWPNVFMEARACGLPVVACREGAGHLAEGEAEGAVFAETADPAEWYQKVSDLLDRPDRLRTLGENARRALEQRVPAWERVLEEDLLPVWRRAAGCGRGAAADQHETTP